MKKNYDDIINMLHHVSKVHPQMSIYDRAAQFAPFAALTGYDDAVKETARIVDDKVELDEYSKSIINSRLLQLIDDKESLVSICYFVADKKKTGGHYLTITGRVKKVDEYKRVIALDNKTIIEFDNLVSIEILK